MSVNSDGLPQPSTSISPLVKKPHEPLAEYGSTSIDGGGERSVEQSSAPALFDAVDEEGAPSAAGQPSLYRRASSRFSRKCGNYFSNRFDAHTAPWWRAGLNLMRTFSNQSRRTTQKRLTTLQTPLPLASLLPLLPPKHLAFFDYLNGELERIEEFYDARLSEYRKRSVITLRSCTLGSLNAKFFDQVRGPERAT